MPTRTKRSGRKVNISFKIEGEVWHRVRSLEKACPDDRIFTVTMNEDGTVSVVFGDGKHGARPPIGSDIIIATHRSRLPDTVSQMQKGPVIIDAYCAGTCPMPNHYFGIFRAIVKDNLDPLQQMRLQVMVPEVFGDDYLVWALPCIPAGKTAIPAINQRVWIAFEEGRPDYPVWIGTVGFSTKSISANLKR